MSIKIALVYPANPFGIKAGGVETFFRGFIKYAPQDFDIEFIGVSSDLDKFPVKRETTAYLGGKPVTFFPVYFEKDENEKRLFPLSLRFVLALAAVRIDFNGKVMLFNRIEPSILYAGNKSVKIGFIHNDILRQIRGSGSEVLWGRMPGMYFKIEKHIFSFLDHIYTVNNENIGFYAKKYPSLVDKISFLPTWVDTDVFSPPVEAKDILRRELKLRYGLRVISGKWILFVGRLQHQKAPTRLIDAFLSYLKTDPFSNFMIIGEGNLRDETESYVRQKKIEDRVVFLGNLSQAEVASFYAASDVLLLASNFEGMPRCVLEALGCGLPVVTTDVGEVRRVVRNGYSGEVADSFSPDRIACSLKKVLDGREKYSRDKCVASIADYTPQKVLAELYDKIRELYKT